MHIAVSQDNQEGVKILLGKCNKKQANAFSQKLRQTPLMIGAWYNSTSCLKLLLESKKCDVSLRDICGDFAIHHAIKKNNHICFKILLEEMKKIDGETLTNLFTEDGICFFFPPDLSKILMISQK